MEAKYITLSQAFRYNLPFVIQMRSIRFMLDLERDILNVM